MGQIQSIVVDFTREQIENAPEFVRLEDAHTFLNTDAGVIPRRSYELNDQQQR
jgi:hypothetical protein